MIATKQVFVIFTGLGRNQFKSKSISQWSLILTERGIHQSEQILSKILVILLFSMDHRTFLFATRGQCIKGKQC